MIKINSREEFLNKVNTYLPANSFCAEIGVLNGDFSDMIFKVIKPFRLILIDPYTHNGETYGSTLNNLTTAYSTSEQYEGVLNRFSNEIANTDIRVVRDYSYNVVKELLDNTFDFIYLDGSHLYEDVKRDLNDWLQKLKAGGLMCGHDYINHESFGVIQAVDEFCKENNFEIIILNENGGDFALRALQ